MVFNCCHLHIKRKYLPLSLFPDIHPSLVWLSNSSYFSSFLWLHFFMMFLYNFLLAGCILSFFFLRSSPSSSSSCARAHSRTHRDEAVDVGILCCLYFFLARHIYFLLRVIRRSLLSFYCPQASAYVQCSAHRLLEHSNTRRNKTKL